MNEDSSTQINYAPLSGTVDAAERKQYAPYTKAALRQATAYLATGGIMAVFAVLGIVSGSIALLLLAGPFALLAAGFGGYSYYNVTSRLQRGIRLKHFAEANNFSFTFSWVPTSEPGSIFKLGLAPHSERIVQGVHGGHPFWFGTHSYTIGNGRNRRIVRTGVLAVQLATTLPHVLLDRKGNATHLSDGVSRSQQLRLEGDFNRHFAVYCPKDYERDVLYFLTPELMQALIDMDSTFDAEIIGDRLYFYRSGDIATDEQTIQGLLELITHVGSNVAKNTVGYQDFRTDKTISGVAPSGASLHMSKLPFIVGVIIVAGLMLLYFVR